MSEVELEEWNNKKFGLKKMYPFLTDSDMLWRDGSRSDLVKELAYRVGVSWRQMEEIVQKL